MLSDTEQKFPGLVLKRFENQNRANDVELMSG